MPGIVLITLYGGIIDIIDTYIYCSPSSPNSQSIESTWVAKLYSYAHFHALKALVTVGNSLN